MKRMLTLLFALALCFPRFAQASIPTISVAANEAKDHAGGKATVYGVAASTRFVASINSAKAYPNNGFNTIKEVDSRQNRTVYLTAALPMNVGLSQNTAPRRAKKGSTAFSRRRAAASRRSKEACAEDLESCSEDGCAEPGSDHALLNSLKHNRVTGLALPLTFKQFKTLQRRADATHLPVGQGTELTKEDRNQLHDLDLGGGVKVGEGSFVQLVGFIAPERTLRASGGESVNCRLTGTANNDMHIPIVEQADGSEYQSIVVEPIPQERPRAWSVPTFNRLQADGRLLMIRGQLLFDNQHKVHDDPDNEDGITNEPKRFTTWEIHPVTELFECRRSENDCDPESLDQWKQIK